MPDAENMLTKICKSIEFHLIIYQIPQLSPHYSEWHKIYWFDNEQRHWWDKNRAALAYRHNNAHKYIDICNW